MSNSEHDDPAHPHLAEVAGHLDRIREGRRGKLRWNVGKHTAELAIGALGGESRERSPLSSKSRRRKRYKRLL